MRRRSFLGAVGGWFGLSAALPKDCSPHILPPVAGLKTEWFGESETKWAYGGGCVLQWPYTPGKLSVERFQPMGDWPEFEVAVQPAGQVSVVTEGQAWDCVEPHATPPGGSWQVFAKKDCKIRLRTDDGFVEIDWLWLEERDS